MEIEEYEYGQRLSDRDAAHVNFVMRNLAAQLMRYTRGSGEISTLVEALLEAGNTARSLSNLSMGDIDYYFLGLRSWTKGDDPTMPGYAEHRAIDTICSGALQVVASRLSGTTQGGAEGKGRNQIANGIEAYKEAIASYTRADERK